MKKIKIPIIRVALILLLVVVVTAQISTGLSAKFISKSEGTSTGRVAHFEAGSFELTTTSEQTTAKLYSDDTKTDGYHAFMFEGQINFPANEVAREFTLDFSIVNDNTATFACPDKVYKLESCGGSSDADASTLNLTNISTLTTEKAYVAYAKVGSGVQLQWNEVDVRDDGSITLSDTPISVGIDAETYTVYVIYFKSFADANQQSSSVPISYSLKTDQVD